MKYGVIIFALVVLAFLVMDFNSRTADLNLLIAAREDISQEFVQAQQTRDTLATQIAYATSPAAAAEWAYQNHMSRPGDQMVVPIQISPVTPTPTPQPTIVVTQVSNIDRWMLLFFGP